MTEVNPTEGPSREELLRKALEEQLQKSNGMEHALPIERLMDRLAAGKKLNEEEYAAISKEIQSIQSRNHEHLSRLEDILSSVKISS
ncbi:MAG: hypothetical protein LDLANPLL_01752 [Turneriella sp.]|nr:hypothetical protein [Turneriella sp.]